MKNLAIIDTDKLVAEDCAEYINSEYDLNIQIYSNIHDFIDTKSVLIHLDLIVAGYSKVANELIEYLNDSGSSIPLLVMSGYHKSMINILPYDSYAGFVAKPNVDDLRSRVANLLHLKERRLDYKDHDLQ